MKNRVAIPLYLLVLGVLLFAAAQVSSSPVTSTAQAASGKRITISLARQRLRAWEGNHVVLSTPVTTGDSALPTPTGYFTVFAKYSPFTFVSPWPQGSAYWYPPSPVSFAMEFAQGGYFIHDAPWRSVFGPGSNRLNAPGTNYGGTHGCVNVPYNAEKFLFYWAPIGTPVHVVP
jgi:lipoprotein-anchoring transpeptidase ErfK/SrfK